MGQNYSDCGDKTRGFSTVNVLRPLKIFIMTHTVKVSAGICQFVKVLIIIPDPTCE